MLAFAERTGLTSDRPTRRYLWTDAFAVCNFLGLARAAREKRYTDLALQLVDQVHHVLGRYRADDARSGWISGLAGQEAESHPTRGGLRIGKKLPERGPGDPFDERLEWDRDGQYFHYLTKWMHALDQVSRSTRDMRFNRWARELAVVAHDSFCRGPGSRRRMVWKMSTDLSRPLVSSLGQHDPLDGFITCKQLETTAALLSATSTGPSLEECTAAFASMLHAGAFATADPLGLGCLLIDAGRVAQLEQDGAWTADDLLGSLLAAALEGVAHYAQQHELRQPASQRLAFRELGLAIGLSALEILDEEVRDERHRFARTGVVDECLQQLASYTALGSAIESFWLEPEHRNNPIWSGHRDINDVMLATCLLPDGFLVLPTAR
jgi:hypothetical protein